MNYDEMDWRKIEGKWNNEPDHLSIDNGEYHLVVFRNSVGTLNGYVGVRVDNPLFGKSNEHSYLNYVDVHGGLTFSGSGYHSYEFKNTHWYFGFDTNHYTDVAPSIIAMEKAMEGLFNPLSALLSSSVSIKQEYRDLNYVTDNVNSLYEQLMSISNDLGKKETSHIRMYRKLHHLKKKHKQWY